MLCTRVPAALEQRGMCDAQTRSLLGGCRSVFVRGLATCLHCALLLLHVLCTGRVDVMQTPKKGGYVKCTAAVSESCDLGAVATFVDYGDGNARVIACYEQAGVEGE